MQRVDPMELNFDGLETQKWNIPTDRAQRVVEKNQNLRFSDVLRGEEVMEKKHWLKIG